MVGDLDQNGAPPARIGVVIADDDHAFATLLTTLVGSDGRFDVLGTARDGSEAVALTFERKPEIVLMDVVMPVVDGVEATRTILALRPSTKVIAVSGVDDAQLALDARLAGAVEYVQKGRVADDLLDAMVAAAPAPAAPPAAGDGEPA
jgi:DNA-binding NarL/FixJ family response regulator